MRTLALLLTSLLALPVQADPEPATFSGMLETHNAARRSVGVPPLTWSNRLAAEAQQWADQLSRENCQLRYDPDPKRRETTGQNLFRAFGSTPYSGTKRTPAEAAARWVREGQQYDHGTHRCKPGLGSQCGAYLQVIWETTTELGCGLSRCDAAEVWVCHYAPRGGQEDLKPYGNPPAVQQSVVSTPPPVQECGWQGPSPAEQFSNAVREQLQGQ